MAAKAKGKQPMVCEEVDEPLSEEEEEETDDEEETDVEEETDDEGAPLKASTGKRKRQVKQRGPQRKPNSPAIRTWSRRGMERCQRTNQKLCTQKKTKCMNSLRRT